MSDDSADAAGALPAPDAPLWPEAAPKPSAPTLPTLPTLPSTSPRVPVAPPTDLWAGDREATEFARRSGSDAAAAAATAPTLTQAGSTVHRYSAKELAEASRIKAVDNPAYGDLPKANAESQAHAEDLRHKAAKIRARNKRLGWYMAIAGIAVVLGIFAVAFVLFQQEDDGETPETTVPAATVPAATVDSVPGAIGATPIGEQVTVISALDVINQGPVAGGGIATDLINDANNAVANLNGATTVP